MSDTEKLHLIFSHFHAAKIVTITQNVTGYVRMMQMYGQFHQLLVNKHINLQGEFRYFKSRIVFYFSKSNRFFELIKFRTVCSIIAAKIEQIFIDALIKVLMCIEHILQNIDDKGLMIAFQIFQAIGLGELLA